MKLYLRVVVTVKNYKYLPARYKKKKKILRVSWQHLTLIYKPTQLVGND